MPDPLTDMHFEQPTGQKLFINKLLSQFGRSEEELLLLACTYPMYVGL